jgi:hypothetical protein
LEGEYVHGLFVDAPKKLAARGIEKIYEIQSQPCRS